MLSWESVTMLTLRDRLRRFADDASGAVAILFGLGVIVLSMVVGLAIDSARFYNINSRIQAALDNAALAAAKVMNADGSTPHEIREAASSFFEVQFRNMSINGGDMSNFHVNFDRREGTVETRVDVSVPTMLGALATGDSRFRFTPVARSKFKIRRVEVALVLDITGSMCSPCSKLDDLKLAAKQMIDALYANNPLAGAIKISLVPYAAAVNVGGHYFGRTAVTQDAVDHCVMEREGINMYTNARPVAGSLFETTGNTPVRPGYSCPDVEIEPLRDMSDADDRQDLKDDIDALTTGGWTAGHLGLAWGWYTLSPEWQGVWTGRSVPRDYDDDVIKAVILMTDGMFNMSYWNNGINLTDEERIDQTVVDSSPYQTLQLCENIKDTPNPDVAPKIYTVSFQAPANADALLQQCAGPGNAFTAENRADLLAAFTGIAERLTQLSITQ
jgi:Flp pilus assembly protein TadG